MNKGKYFCPICNSCKENIEDICIGKAKGNTARFRNKEFYVWKCPECGTIISMDRVDFKDIYKDYILNKRTMDFFGKITLNNLLKRLKKCGLEKEHLILDYGCGSGLFVDLLKQSGYKFAFGFDPYVKEFSQRPNRKFDFIILNDVIEHVDDPRDLVKDCITLLKPKGRIYIGTADSDGIDMKSLDSHRTQLHLPYHRVIINKNILLQLGEEFNLKVIKVYIRSYMDTLVPFVNYRFLDEFNKSLGYNMEDAFNPASTKILLRKPHLLFFAFLGFFFPSAYEPAVIFQKE